MSYSGLTSLTDETHADGTDLIQNNTSPQKTIHLPT